MKEKFTWHTYSKKSEKLILDPYNAGSFTSDEALERKMHLAIGKSGKVETGNMLIFYWLVDPEDGAIVDCKYQLFGDAIFIAIAEVTSAFLIGKHYIQANNITAELIDKRLLDKKEKELVMEGHLFHLNLAIDAIEAAVEECKALPLPTNYVTPIVAEGVKSQQYPGWLELSKHEQLQLVEELFSEEIRPYIELDEGGVRVLDINGNEVSIAYEGACTTCYSSVGSTLSSIQNILQTKLYPSLVVVPSF